MKRVIILVTVVLLAFGSTFNAQPRSGNGNGMKMNATGNNNASRMQTLLNLTDKQKVKISDLRFAHEQMAIDTRSKIEKNKLFIRKMMMDNKVNENKLLSRTSDNSKLHSKIVESKTKMWLDVYKILDETQKALWTKNFNRMMQHGKKSKHGSMKSNCRNGKHHKMR